MLDRINEIMRLLFLQVKDKLEARYGCFEIFAFDFLLEEDDLTPRLMEVSSSPSFSTEMLDSKPIIRSLVRDSITMVQDLHEKNREKAREAMIERVLTCGLLKYDVIYREPGAAQ